MRATQRPAPGEMVEEIMAYEVNYTGIVRVQIAQGWNVDGVFQPFQGQTFEMREILFEDYEELMAANKETGKPAGDFRKDDLWPLIERARSGRDAVSLRRALGRKDV